MDSANPKRIVLVAINKTGHPIAGVFKLANLPQRSVITVHQLTGETPSPRPAGNIPLATPESFPYTLPAFSVSTLGIILP